MPVEETKHDLWLKRVQITIAILAGLATLIVGAYNIKKTLFTKENPEPVLSVRTPEPPPAQSVSPLRSALEETGASWIKKLGEVPSKSDSKNES
ncbi:MAG: hypothetical protein HY592_02265 [Candidatus Omnitrophica bacterium]|nr:hypothetical protein [Candidatus Omnitrophota bacterium]